MLEEFKNDETHSIFIFRFKSLWSQLTIKLFFDILWEKNLLFFIIQSEAEFIFSSLIWNWKLVYVPQSNVGKDDDENSRNV